MHVKIRIICFGNRKRYKYFSLVQFFCGSTTEGLYKLLTSMIKITQISQCPLLNIRGQEPTQMGLLVTYTQAPRDFACCTRNCHLICANTQALRDFVCCTRNCHLIGATVMMSSSSKPQTINLLANRYSMGSLLTNHNPEQEGRLKHLGT